MKNQYLILYTLLGLLIVTHSSAKPDFKELLKNSFTLNQEEITQGTVTFASVGPASDAECDYTSIQDAVDSGVDQVRISTATNYFENIIIQNNNISLIGGYARCFVANTDVNNISGYSTIDGGGNGIVIQVNNDNSSYDVNFTNLRLINGSYALISGTGGISLNGMGTRVNMDNLWISDNLGSGISANDIDILVIKDSIIANNTNLTGAGIYCSQSFVTIFGNSVIRANTASSGGGVYATNQCGFTIYSGQPFPSAGSSGINSNTASQNGGGIYATQASTINMFGHEIDFGNGNILGDATRAVYLLSNTANNGAGVYLDGTNTTANLSGVFIASNIANINGGGIAVTQNAQLALIRYEIPCYSDLKCNYFSGNMAGTGLTGGGAIYTNNSSQIGIANTYFANNTAGFGNAILAIGNVTGTIEGSIFTNNNGHSGRAGNFVIDVEDGSNLTIGFNTFVDNLASTSTLGVKNSHIENVGNLFYEYTSGTVLTLTTATATNYCLLSRDTSGLVGLNIVQAVIDPFVDRNSQDYHLDEILGISAMDQCDTNTYYPSNKDIDLEPRGINLPLANTDGPYDIGADEFFVEDLFKNGFE
jgi:hypothetical protein